MDKNQNYILIRDIIINHEVYQNVKDFSKEKEKVSTYYEIGKLLYDTGSIYGNNTINEFSKKLTKEFGANYSYRNLVSYKKFYSLFNNEKLNALRSKLSWTHYRELIKLKNIEEIIYYIDISINQHLSYRKLSDKIKSKEYERLPEDTKNKLITKENTNIEDFIKNPIVIKNNSNYEIISEKILQKLILDDIPTFLKELGNGFTFIDNEYKIKIGSSYNYIDLLLFNYEYNCFVVVELKVTELKKEHIGQIEIYMNYIDKKIKKITHDNTIGIIICKKDNKFVMEYCSDKRILAKEYELV